MSAEDTRRRVPALAIPLIADGVLAVLLAGGGSFIVDRQSDLSNVQAARIAVLEQQVRHLEMDLENATKCMRTRGCPAVSGESDQRLTDNRQAINDLARRVEVIEQRRR